MSETIACPHCAAGVAVPASAMGQMVQCPGCHEPFLASQAGDEDIDVDDGYGKLPLRRPRPPRRIPRPPVAPLREGQVPCPHCDAVLDVPPHVLSQMVQCPSCHEPFRAEVPPPLPDPELNGDEDHGDTATEEIATADEDQDDEDLILPSIVNRKAPLPGIVAATLTCVFLGIGALFTIPLLVQLVGDILRLRDPWDLLFPDQALFLTRVAALFTVLGSVTFLMWVSTAYRNLDLLEAEGRQYSAGWAVGSFFVPLLNLFRPYQVLQELWQASDPRLIRDPWQWENSGVSLMVMAWWSFDLVALAARMFMRFVTMRGGRDAADTALRFEALVTCANIASTLFLILVVIVCTRRQRQRYRLLRERDEAAEADIASEQGEDAAP